MSLPAPSACLVVLDGWGLAPDGPGNAVSLAQTPTFDALWERYPTTTLTACGRWTRTTMTTATTITDARP